MGAHWFYTTSTDLLFCAIAEWRECDRWPSPPPQSLFTSKTPLGFCRQPAEHSNLTRSGCSVDVTSVWWKWISPQGWVYINGGILFYVSFSLFPAVVLSTWSVQLITSLLKAPHDLLSVNLATAEWHGPQHVSYVSVASVEALSDLWPDLHHNQHQHSGSDADDQVYLVTWNSTKDR